MMKPLLASLLVLCAGVAAAASDTFTIGPWKPGMAREQALAFGDNGPFKAGKAFNEYDAVVTFLGRKSPVTLGFDDRGLKTQQLRRYDGNSARDAKAAALEIFAVFEKEFGGASVENVQNDDGKPLDRASLGEALDKILDTARELAERSRRKDKSFALITFDMIPKHQPASSRVHSQWGYSAKTDRFYVDLFQDRIDAPLRRARSNVFLERIR